MTRQFALVAVSVAAIIGSVAFSAAIVRTDPLAYRELACRWFRPIAWDWSVAELRDAVYLDREAPAELRGRAYGSDVGSRPETVAAPR